MVEAAGIPIGLATDGANRNDCKLTEPTISSIPIERPQPSAEALQGVCLDKAYDHDFVREMLDELDFVEHIRSRGEEARELREDLGERARRWVVERVHSWINRLPRPADPLVQKARQPRRAPQVLLRPDHVAADRRDAVIETGP